MATKTEELKELFQIEEKSERMSSVVEWWDNLTDEEKHGVYVDLQSYATSVLSILDNVLSPLSSDLGCRIADLLRNS